MHYPISVKLQQRYGQLWVIELQLALRRNGLKLTYTQVRGAFRGRKKWFSPAVVVVANGLVSSNK